VRENTISLPTSGKQPAEFILFAAYLMTMLIIHSKQ
jgi:hypothetical protein